MSDKEKVSLALQLASQTCSAALTALTTLVSTSDQSNTPASLPTLLADYSALLTLIYAAATKVSLSLKPSSPTYSASLAPIKDITSHTDALASCACSINPTLHGQTLAKEIRWTTEDVVNAVQGLLRVFMDDANSNDRYLTKTGALHEIVDRARGISTSNWEAVRKRWEADTSGLEDGVKEVAEMVQDESNDQHGSMSENSDDEGDGWDELGLGLSSSQPSATKEEIACLESTHSLLRFTHAMHKRVRTSLSGRTPSLFSASSPDFPPRVFDSALSHSNALLAASDELVSALYTPQDPSILSIRLLSFKSAIQAIEGCLASLGLTTPSGSALEDSFVTLNLQDITQSPRKEDSTESQRGTKEQKWFDVCFQQIYRAHETAVGTVTR